MRTRRSLAGTLLLTLVVLLLLGADAPQRQLPPGRTSPSEYCASCEGPLEPQWRYCPWCGERIDRTPGPRQATSPLDPKETVLAFFEAYQKQDRRAMAEVLDLGSVLSEWINKSLDRWEGLPKDLLELMRERAVSQMAEALSPVVLEILTSDEMLRSYRPPAEVTYDFLKPYNEKIEGQQAWLYPNYRIVRVGSFADHTFYLRKKNGRWVIIRLPFLIQ